MEKINKLKKLFKYYNLDGYIVPKNDEFFCEYIPENKDKLKFITNFSGSYGFALILKNKNYLFVDGRYTLQANIQSNKLFKIVTIPNKLPSNILKQKKLKIGYDPKLHTKKNLEFFFDKTNCKYLPINQNLIEKLWNKKRERNIKNFYILPERAVGETCKTKIKKLVDILKKKKIYLKFITESEKIERILNIKEKDSDFTPTPN